MKIFSSGLDLFTEAGVVRNLWVAHNRESSVICNSLKYMSFNSGQLLHNAYNPFTGRPLEVFGGSFSPKLSTEIVGKKKSLSVHGFSLQMQSVFEMYLANY